MLKRARLSAVSLGVAIGFLCGGFKLVVGLLAVYKGVGTELINHWATIFPGIEITVTGALIAGAWGFLMGFFSGLILGWIYNLCLCCCGRSHCACCKTSCGCTKCNTVVVEEKTKS